MHGWESFPSRKKWWQLAPSPLITFINHVDIILRVYFNFWPFKKKTFGLYFGNFWLVLTISDQFWSILLDPRYVHVVYECPPLHQPAQDQCGVTQDLLCCTTCIHENTLIWLHSVRRFPIPKYIRETILHVPAIHFTFQGNFCLFDNFIESLPLTQNAAKIQK